LSRDPEERMTRTTRHLIGREFDAFCDFTRDSVVPFSPRDRVFIPRLSWMVTPKSDYDRVEFAHDLARHPAKPHVFVDTSMFDRRTDLRVWRALLSRHHGITIIPAVHRELAPWLESHPEHPAAQAIRLRDPAVDLREYGTNSPKETAALTYYVRLLGLRKQLFAGLTTTFEQEHGRPPTLEELRREAHRTGPRGYLLGKKGAAASGSPNFLTDEMLVFTAVAAGLRSGRPTYILTKDEDVQEQFYKLIWLLDTHYRGMLLANAFAEEPARFRTLPMPMSEPEFADAFWGDGNVLVEMSEGTLDNILPARCRFVSLHCCILGSTRTEMIFGAEREMAAVLDIKGVTRGRSTDQFGQRDCHAWLAPLNIPEPLRGCASIAHNRVVTLPNSDAKVSALDCHQALFCGERFGRIRGRESPLL
jgi:hypothetical protein